MVWDGKDLKSHPVPTPGTPPTILRCSSLALDNCRDGDSQPLFSFPLFHVLRGKELLGSDSVSIPPSHPLRNYPTLTPASAAFLFPGSSQGSKGCDSHISLTPRLIMERLEMERTPLMSPLGSRGSNPGFFLPFLFSAALPSSNQALPRGIRRILVFLAVRKHFLRFSRNFPFPYIHSMSTVSQTDSSWTTSSSSDFRSFMEFVIPSEFRNPVFCKRICFEKPNSNIQGHKAQPLLQPCEDP